MQSKYPQAISIDVYNNGDRCDAYADTNPSSAAPTTKTKTTTTLYSQRVSVVVIHDTITSEICPDVSHWVMMS